MSAIGKNLVGGYLAKLAEITATGKIYAYRGQANADWPLESSAFRRLKKSFGHPPTKKQFIHYLTNQILEPARMNGYGIKDGQKLSDLELLAELQHFGAATCLMDFTRDFLVALWFACQTHEKKNGKVFVMDISSPETFLSLEQQDLEHERVEAILDFQTRKTQPLLDEGILRGRKPHYWHWSPQGMNQRILKQNSLFVFGRPWVDNSHLSGAILIRHEDRSGVLQELETLGVTQESLFKDMPGFAVSHGHGQSTPPIYKFLEDYLLAGNAAHQRGDFEKAKNFYSKAIEIKPDYADTYHDRGSAKQSLGDNEGALADYTKAIEINPDFAIAYNNRGGVKRKLNDHEGAMADCTKAIELVPDDALAYYNRGVTKQFLGDKEGAVADYTEVIKINPDDAGAYYNRGAAKHALGDYESAMADYTKAIEIQPNHAGAYNNRGMVKSTLGDDEGATRDFAEAKEIGSGARK